MQCVFLNGCGEVNVSLPGLLKNYSSVAYIGKIEIFIIHTQIYRVYRRFSTTY